MPMLLCVTPNTALDRTVVIDRLISGEVHRASSSVALAGGKGVNAARAAQNLGATVMVAGILGGHIGEMVAESAADEGMEGAWTWGDGETRICTTIVTGETATVINESGIQIQPHIWLHFTFNTIHAAREADASCICGSLPPGVTPEMGAELARNLRAENRLFWFDSSSAALKSVVEIGINIKVNGDEFAAVFGISPDEIVPTAKNLHAQYGGEIVLTLGADGAIMIGADGTFRAQPPKIDIVSAVGSGDSFLAGLMVARAEGKSASESLRAATAAGAANALSIGAGRFKMEDYLRIFALTHVSDLG